MTRGPEGSAPKRPQAISAPALYGLVLAGGRSSRMQRDKAVLTYGGRAQLERAMDLIRPYVVRAFVSVRPDQVAEPTRASYPQIVDSLENTGPIAGILAAQTRYPDVAWLVLACDLPFLGENTLDRLVQARMPHRDATAYRSTHDGLPEPLCAIYEPASHRGLSRHVTSGRQCPRKFLLNADTELIEQPDTRALDNINTPEEYGCATSTLAASGDVRPSGTRAPEPLMNRITVQYYALLREQAGRSSETLRTGARTPRELYQELKQRYPFSLAPEMLRVAINSEFGDWTQPLKDGDAIVFIPPVAGG